MEIADFRDRKLVFIDLEMTGLNPLIHEITEIGAIVINGKTFEVEKEYEQKVKPEHLELADKAALEIHGYSEELWKNAKPLLKVLGDLSSFAPNGLLAGWNVGTDKMFLEIAYLKEKVPFPFDYHALDIVPLAWQYALQYPELKELRLTQFCEHLGIERKDMHRALADIRVTVEVFKKLVSNNPINK